MNPTLLSFLEKTDRILGLALDPHADRHHAPRIIALHNGHDVFVFTPDPESIALLRACDLPMATHDAKRVHTSLAVAHLDIGQPRWACTMIVAQLVNHSNVVYPEAPDANASIEALGALAEHHRNIALHQMPWIKSTGQNRISRIESRAIAPIASMETRGMPFSSEQWRKADRDAKAEVNAIILQKDTPQKLHRMKQLKKLITAYGLNYLDHVSPDGRIHPTFIQIGASTGRMACQNPNLQAVVSEGPHRASFHTPPGRTLIIADYSACELRILCEMSDDPVFKRAFSEKLDIHSEVASTMFDVRVSKTEHPELRKRAKAISFGLVYGMGAGGLAKTLDVDRDRAETLLNDYFKRFPRIRDYLESAAELGIRNGYVTTLGGRRLHLPQNIDHAAKGRLARNMPIQGTNADITKLAMGDLYSPLKPFHDAGLVNAVHDELVIECDVDNADAVASTVQNAMVQAGESILKNTPVEVDVHISTVWAK